MAFCTAALSVSFFKTWEAGLFVGVDAETTPKESMSERTIVNNLYLFIFLLNLPVGRFRFRFKKIS